MDRTAVESVVRALRRVNFQGSILGQTVAIRLGLSESDIDALELLIDSGAATAGRLAELMGLTTSAVTRVIDRLEQAGYVRRELDPADRRRVVVDVVPERVATIDSLLDSLERAAEHEVERYSPEQLALINDFLSRMADLTQTESTRLRSSPEGHPSEPTGPAEHAAPLAGLKEARLTFRSGAQELRIGPGGSTADLYRARFEGATPHVRLREGRVLVQYRGVPFDWRKRVATMNLNTTIPWGVEITGDVVRVEADLRQIELRRLDLTGGSDRIRLELGTPIGEVPINVVGGVRTLRLERPIGSALSLKVQGGAGRVEFDGKLLAHKAGELTAESPGSSAASSRFAVKLIGGAEAIEIVQH